MLVWQAHKNFVRQIVFLGDGRTVATTAGRSRFVWVWEAATRRLVGKLDTYRPLGSEPWVGVYRSVVGMVATPDGRRLVTLNLGWLVRVWDTTTNAITHGWQVGGSGQPLAVAPDGATVVMAPRAGTVEVFDLPRPADPHGRPATTRVLEPTPWYSAFAFSPDGKWLAGHKPHGVSLWYAGTFQRFDRPAEPAGGPIGPVVFSPDGTRVAAARGPQVHTWVRDRWAAGPVVRGNGAPVADAAFSPDGRTLLSVGRDGTIRMSDAETGEPRQTFDFGVGEVRAAAFSPDGLTAAAGGAKGQIVVWDVDG